MSLSFDKKQVKPGDNVTVVITSAAPASYVGIVAVDQSVYLQQNKNHLTTEIVSISFTPMTEDAEMVVTVTPTLSLAGKRTRVL